MASGLSLPIGFKNTLFGEMDPALNGILAARQPQTYLGIDELGRASALKSPGNPLAHLVLRGSEEGPNFDSLAVQKALHLLQNHSLSETLLIDCSHGNSGKNPSRQRIAFNALLEQARQGVHEICGFMIESHLYEGRQQTNKHYGVSLTDPCIGWEETEELLRAACLESSLPISMSSVQK